MSEAIRVRADVAEAIARGRPVVALESTLIAHGLPRPDNLELARELEGIIAAEGAVPATIGVVDGVATVGLDARELELMARTPDVPKLSIRDLPIARAKRSNGATTVASTSHLAARAGVKLFATGGLGGVHRAARESWDISADLLALSHTPVAVVCAGVKSILDIPATLEYLESCGVPVIGYRTRQFPGFYLTDSGYPLEWSVDGPEEAARVFAAMPALGLGDTGLIIANPIPTDEQLDADQHDRVLAGGLGELERRGIRGKGVTPFLLDYLKTVTGGESLRANKSIIRNNARVAARVARALAEEGR